MGKAPEASFFNGGELIESGGNSTGNSSKLREVLEDLCILKATYCYGVKERRMEWQILYTEELGFSFAVKNGLGEEISNPKS